MAATIADASTAPVGSQKDINVNFPGDKKITVVFVLGGPGSGKGTQCANIVKNFGFTHLSAGDLLRAEIKSGSENGAMIQNMIKEGKIVPSEVTIKLLQRAMLESGNDKFLIDGFPRNKENRAAFESVTKVEPDFVLFFDCSEEEMERRLLNRNQGRDDDNIDTIRKRFKVFLESSLPVIEYYKSKGKVRKVDAGKPVDEVYEDVKAIFAPYNAQCLAFLQEISTDVVNNAPHSSLQQSHIQNPVATDSSNSEGNPDDNNAEANAYFHQMFSGQLTIDAMVQMLARFKESPEKRDQLIFDCMISNLFEEYKFFPKYPEKQLKMAALLFGSLIKHQLVTRLDLGIALRGVLDALRKPVDSKMFMFGTKALEQFIDRLVEWPQYCNHILEISHLRATHPELVSVTERTLVRISSSQTEYNGGSSIPADSQQGSTQASV